MAGGGEPDPDAVRAHADTQAGPFGQRGDRPPAAPLRHTAAVDPGASRLERVRHPDRDPDQSGADEADQDRHVRWRGWPRGVHRVQLEGRLYVRADVRGGGTRRTLPGRQPRGAAHHPGVFLVQRAGRQQHDRDLRHRARQEHAGRAGGTAQGPAAFGACRLCGRQLGRRRRRWQQPGAGAAGRRLDQDAAGDRRGSGAAAGPAQGTARRAHRQRREGQRVVHPCGPRARGRLRLQRRAGRQFCRPGPAWRAAARVPPRRQRSAGVGAFRRCRAEQPGRPGQLHRAHR
ncbi:hypothetical protein D3C71_1354000 [compost metagenome]